MVEKIIVNPASVRAYGNIMDSRDVDDFELYNTSIVQSTDTINGVEQTVFVTEYQGE